MNFLYQLSLVILLSFTSFGLFGQQHTDLFYSGSSIAKGFTNTTETGINSLLGNQSGLKSIDNFGAIVSSEQRFGISDLNVISLGIAKRIEEHGVIGLMIGSFGLDALKQQTLVLNYSREMSEVWDLSVAFDVFRIDASEFGSTNKFSFQIGSLFSVADGLKIGMHIKNPFSSDIDESTNYGGVYSLGLTYDFDDKVSLSTQLTIVNGASLNFRNGLSYQLHEKVDFNIGFATNPSTVHFGLGINLSETFRLDGAFYRHESLGLSPALSVSYEN